jgi:hypothetical protein
MEETPKKRPGWLTAICVGAIVLGSLGLLSALGGAATLLMGDFYQKTMMRMQTAGQPPAVAKSFQKLQDEMKAVADDWKGVNAGLLFLQFLVAGGLLAGGILTMRLRPNGRNLLLKVFLVAILLDGVRAIPSTLIQIETMAVMERYMSNVAAGSPSGRQTPRKMPPMVKQFMRAGVLIGVGFMMLMLALKMAYYIAGILYLRRPSIRDLIEGGGAGETVPVDA